MEVSVNSHFILFLACLNRRHFYARVPRVVVSLNKVVKNINIFVGIVCREILEHFFYHCSVPTFGHRRFLLIFSRVKLYTQLLHMFVVKLSAFSVQSFSGFRFDFLKISLNASPTDFPVLSLSGSIQPYFENTSITVSRYLTSRLNFENACISTRSAAQILSIPFTYTFRFGKILMMGLWSSSASWSVHVVSFF